MASMWLCEPFAPESHATRPADVAGLARQKPILDAIQRDPILAIGGSRAITSSQMLKGATVPKTDTWDLETDVLVAGYGAAGCAAAIEARRAGAEVLVLEKMPAGKEGGNSRVSGGVWYRSTDPERMKTYLRALCGGFPIPEPIIDVWARETHLNTEWIESLGVRTAQQSNPIPEYAELEGSDAYDGYIGVDGQWGQGILWETLAKAVADHGIEVLIEARTHELVQDPETGTVLGAVVRHDGRAKRVRARRGVVLATGGFENNPEMVHDYLGIGGVPVMWGSQAGTGDGIKMAMKAGADLWHMDNMMTAVGIRVPGFDSGFLFDPPRPGYIFVGLDGTRFANELPHIGHGQALVGGSFELFPLKPAHFLFDETTRLAGPVCPNADVLPVGYNVVMEKYEWSADNTVEIDKGWLLKADSWRELAVLLNVDPDALEATVDRYNASCTAGVDDQFGRPTETLLPLLEPPFYACSWGPMLAWSNGGPRRNEYAQVIDAFGKVIPRLYAAGNISSTYSWCKDGGFHLADAMAFGRVAGRTAAAEL
jgi:succinate dehydrogenase/fumarate reductase flavoprotein subunit